MAGDSQGKAFVAVGAGSLPFARAVGKAGIKTEMKHLVENHARLEDEGQTPKTWAQHDLIRRKRNRVRIQHGGWRARVRLLDERNAEAAMRDPEAFRAQTGELLDTPDGSIVLELLPYAITRIDVFEAKLM
jgi:FtsZ-binding cell division protein ZapB